MDWLTGRNLDFAALSVLCVALGGILKTVLDNWLARRSQDLERNKLEIGSDETMRREMAIQNAALQTRVDLLMATVDSWQGRFYDLQLKLGLMEPDVGRLILRVTELENVNCALTIERTALQARISILEGERLGLLNRITVLEQQLRVLGSSPEVK